MKLNFKKIITLLLAVLLVISMCPTSFAADASPKAVTLADENRRIIGEYDALDTAFKAAYAQKLTSFILRLNSDITVDKTVALNNTDEISYVIDGAGHRITQTTAGKNALEIGGCSTSNIVIKDLEVFGTHKALVITAGIVTIESGYFSATSNTFQPTVDVYPLRDYSVTLNVLGGKFESIGGSANSDVYRRSSLRVANAGNSHDNGATCPVVCNIYGGYFYSEYSNFTVENVDYAQTNVYGGTFFNNRNDTGYSFINNNGNPATKSCIYAGTFILPDSAGGSVVRNHKAGGEMYVYGGNFIGGSGLFRQKGTGSDDNSDWGSGPKYATLGDVAPIMVKGAGIRLVKDSAGISFTVNVSKTTVDKLSELGDKDGGIKFGAIIVDASAVAMLPTITKDALAANGVSYQEVTATGTFDTSKDITYSVALKNMNKDNASKTYVAIPYAVATVGGAETYFYGIYDAASARSLSQIAKAALADISVTYTADQLAVLNAYAQ